MPGFGWRHLRLSNDIQRGVQNLDLLFTRMKRLCIEGGVIWCENTNLTTTTSTTFNINNKSSSSCNFCTYHSCCVIC